MKIVWFSVFHPPPKKIILKLKQPSLLFNLTEKNCIILGEKSGKIFLSPTISKIISY